jgi:hypothetical protein
MYNHNSSHINDNNNNNDNDNDNDNDNNNNDNVSETSDTSEISDTSDTSETPKVHIITVRGIKCICTIPFELIWGKKGCCLECSNCLKNAIDPISKVLIGLCYICAEKYDYKYGCGYFENLDGYERIPTAFGGLNTEYVIDKVQELSNNIIGQYQIANNPEHIWSIYDMTIRLSNDDINLLTKKNNYGWQEFYNYYEIKDGSGLEQDLDVIIDIVCSLQKNYEITDDDGDIRPDIVDALLFDKEFYTDCFDYQKDFPENKQNPEGNIQTSNLYKYKCEYCNICKPKKKLHKCGNCSCVRYCSIACQKRDWKNKHKNVCSILAKQGEDVD